MNWNGNQGGGGARVITVADMLRKAQTDAATHLQEVDFFTKVKPLLEKCLQLKIQNRTPIRVLSSIQNITESLSKGEAASAGITGEVIPAGTELVYDGFELGKMFFKCTDGKEYGIHTGENVMTGGMMPVRNPGLIGLLTKTDVYTTVMSLLEQRRPK